MAGTTSPSRENPYEKAPWNESQNDIFIVVTSAQGVWVPGLGPGPGLVLVLLPVPSSQFPVSSSQFPLPLAGGPIKNANKTLPQYVTMLFPFSPFEKTTKRLANIFNLKWLWVLFGLPEISLAAGQRVWAWHLRVLTMTGLCGISSRCLVVAPFFFPQPCKSVPVPVLVLENSVIYRQNSNGGGGILTLGFLSAAAPAGIQIYWWANRKHGQYGYRKRSLVV